MSLLDLTLMEKQVVGSLFGSGNPRADIPKLLGLYREGQLDLDGLVTNTYALDGVNEGYDACGPWTWTFDNIKVNMNESSGDIVYLNHGDFVINDTIKTKVDFLESATFRKVDGKWKMNFLHSTVKK